MTEQSEAGTGVRPIAAYALVDHCLVAMELALGHFSQEAADRLAALTAQAARVPTVLIQLADGPQLRMTGGYGVPPEWERITSVSLTSTLAGMVFNTGFPLVIEDVETDRRVPLDAPIRGVGRAYVGFPIRDPDGEVVGVCGIVDQSPRRWTGAELSAVDHAAQACTALVAKQLALHDAERQRGFRDALLDSLDVGVSACDAEGRLMLFNAAMGKVHPEITEMVASRAEKSVWAGRCICARRTARPSPAITFPWYGHCTAKRSGTWSSWSTGRAAVPGCSWPTPSASAPPPGNRSARLSSSGTSPSAGASSGSATVNWRCPPPWPRRRTPRRRALSRPAGRCWRP
jgi:GAF domain